jgi:ATP-dependent RNA helicase UAP56/SUB2
LLRNDNLSFKNLKHFIIDECDKMLEVQDMRIDVQRIFCKAPIHKQVMMFSATFSSESKDICRKFLTNPFELFIEGD